MIGNDIFGRDTRPPADLDREGRIRLMAEVALALLRGELPSAPARLFVAGAIRAFLQNGGSLERDYLRLHCQGSHRTLQVIAREFLFEDERQDANDSID